VGEVFSLFYCIIYALDKNFIMNKTATKIIIAVTAGNLIFSSLLFLQLRELESRFVILHDDFNLVIPKFSNDILDLNKKLSSKK